MKSEVRIRTVTALIVAPFVVACFISYESLVGLVSAIVLLSSYELLSFSLRDFKKVDISVLTAFSTLFPLIYGLLLRNDPLLALSVVFIAGVVYILLRGFDPESASKMYFSFFASVLYVSVNLSFFMPIYDRMGGSVALLVLTSVWAYDIFAYFSGMKLGKRRIFERYTRKTLEGVLGGFLGTIIYTSIYKLISESIGFNVFSWKLVVPFSVIVAVMDTFGDVFESSLKRRFGVKDSGVIMPGHGGMLDRIDGLLFVVPVVYIVLGGIS